MLPASVLSDNILNKCTTSVVLWNSLPSISLTWSSFALSASSWAVCLSREKQLICYLQLKILAFKSKDWVIDYGGNGAILSKPDSGVSTYSGKIDLKPKKVDEPKLDSKKENESDSEK